MKKLRLKKPVISVVIPTLNEEKQVAKCLKSLKNQDFKKPFELIIVDGGSSDRTTAIAREFDAIVILQKGRGIGDARYWGFQQAKGEIVASTDADAILPSDWLEKIENYFSQNLKVGALTGDFELTRDSDFWLRNLFKLGPLINRVIAFFVGHPYFSSRNFAIRKKIYNQVGGFDRRLKGLEDAELSTRVAKVTSISHLPDLKVRTPDRRWRGRFLKHILTRMLPTFWFNVVIKKPHPKFNEWERIN